MHFLITLATPDGCSRIEKVNATLEEMRKLKAGDLWAGLPILRVEQIEYVRVLTRMKG